MKEGIGLRNGRARLTHLYGDLGGLALGRREERTVAEVTIPLRQATA
jgi:sensor histidine kinase YesM